jgi:cbb3-type cytochrome oxidase maturation protein
MKIMLFLIVLSLIVASGFLLAFLWATRTGQFDDEYTPSVRMLFDNEKKRSE